MGAGIKEKKNQDTGTGFGPTVFYVISILRQHGPIIIFVYLAWAN